MKSGTEGTSVRSEVRKNLLRSFASSVQVMKKGLRDRRSSQVVNTEKI